MTNEQKDIIEKLEKRLSEMSFEPAPKGKGIRYSDMSFESDRAALRKACEKEVIAETADKMFGGHLPSAEHWWRNPLKKDELVHRTLTKLKQRDGTSARVVKNNTPPPMKLPIGMAANADGYTFSEKMGLRTPYGTSVPEHLAAKQGVNVAELKAAAAKSAGGAE